MANQNPSASERGSNNRPSLDRLLSPREIAEHLGLSVRTIMRLIKSGQLRAHRIGGSIRIAESDLKALIAISRM